MLKTKCILAPIESDDWYRISIMSRHTLNDWKTPDNRIIEQFDVHMKEFWPAPKMVGAYYRWELSRSDFKNAYLTRLSSIELIWAIKFLSSKLVEWNITLLCIEEDPTFCHRKLLAQEFLKYNPWLVIDIK